jgi:hypothetical protein
VAIRGTEEHKNDQRTILWACGRSELTSLFTNSKQSKKEIELNIPKAQTLTRDNTFLFAIFDDG